MNGRLRIYVTWTPEQFIETFDVFDQLVRAGHEPVMQACAPNWYEMDRQWLASCHCLLRRPGISLKADFAVDSAKVLGLPVYFSLRECLAALPTNQGASR